MISKMKSHRSASAASSAQPEPEPQNRPPPSAGDYDKLTRWFEEILEDHVGDDDGGLKEELRHSEDDIGLEPDLTEPADGATVVDVGAPEVSWKEFKLQPNLQDTL